MEASSSKPKEARAGEPPEQLLAVWCPGVAFDRALAWQEQLRELLIAGRGEAVMLLCEHPPSLTLGRRGQEEDLLWDPKKREDFGLSVFETPRGGEATLHAPGQLVVYPVVYVGKRIRAHIEALAEAALYCLSKAGIRGATLSWDHPGVWRDAQKFASVGVHVSRGVAIQGLSLNVDVDPRLFGALVSCGMPSVQMASLWPHREPAVASSPYDTDQLPPMQATARLFATAFAQARGSQLRWIDEAELEAILARS